MAPRYDELAVTVLRLDPAHPIRRGYQLMRFPGRWKEPLRRLAQARRGGDVASIPIGSLNEAITALVPDCVVTLPYAGRGDADQDWLLAYREINPAAIFALVAAWVRAQKATPDQIQLTLAQLNATDLAWSPVHLDLTTPDDRQRAMRLLPMEIAATLSRPDACCPHNNLRFLRCPSPDGAELISWPAERIEDQTPFSVKVGITAQTLPTSEEVLIYLSFGVRRWMPVRGKLASDHGHSVYLAPTVPYLTGLENSRHFGTARIRRTRVTAADGTTAYEARWDDAVAQVLQEAGCLDRLPDPAQLVDKPMDYLQRHGDASALVYSTGMLSSEKVSAGLSVADREPLMTWIATELNPQFRLATPLPREKCAVYKGLGGAIDGPISASYLRDIVGPRLDIELLTDTEPATRYALDRLATRLGVSAPSSADLDGTGTLLDLGDLTVRIRHIPAPSIRADLERAGRSTRLAVQARIEDIIDTLGTASHPTISLVEIGHPDDYQGRRRGDDPKFAIRQGLLQTGRLSQFITPVADPKRPPRVREGKEPSDANRERFAAAVDDLFRQLGVRPQPLPEPVRGTIPRRPAVLGIWMIRQNKGQVWGVARQVPVAVLADPTGREVQVCAPQVPWQPLRTGLIEIGKRYVEANLKCGPEDVVRFIKDVVDQAVDAYPDTLLLTHAQNLRSVWNTLANSRMQLDALGFGAGEPQPIGKLRGLRHVRVRTAEGGETPECYGVSATETGQPRGLWRFLLGRVYGSTSTKPSTSSGALKGVSKLVPGEHNGKLQAPKAKAQVWNPQFIELTVAGLQDGDSPEHWAALAHDLRDAAPYARNTTILPWPLHLAEQIEEYLLPSKVGTTPSADSSESE
ncbi:pPIWI_RE module domain-containing protein [Actinoplanes sp. CA-030573]|uniref:pPIWI_RE module domain-containing protein n=1 Tax=Actinoplanes sp. CA-030573 TaxID=3239898 RepID=UPI003D8D0D80